ncbi:MAG: RagB/SusD family nutrient uptake outer membrane protein [Prevotella sp.]|nr:RagB/SusD family nutrient uptake outer membrane protein [Prevotella sp.]
MMDIDNDRVAYDEQHRIDNPNDSIYSVMGILAQLQQVADRVVLMGELRADLMTVDPQYASTDLQDIESLSYTNDNVYARDIDFYAIINNCNYILQRMDTSLVEGQTKVMMPEYAQVKTLRAYTYWQMAQIFGQVSYFTEPLLSSMSSYHDDRQTLGIDALAPLLIADLEPLVDERPLDYGSVDGWNSSEFFLPTRMLLGDLYLYSNRYEEAAQAYYDLIQQRRLTVSSGYANTWMTVARTSLNANNQQAFRNEVITRQVFDSDLRSLHSQLGKLTYSDEPSLLPAAHFTSWMQQRTHFHTDNGQGISRYFTGDLRGLAEMSTGKQVAQAFGPADAEQIPGATSSRLLITKYFNNLEGSTTDQLSQRTLRSLPLVRPTTVYLRYAEAINRAGFPTAAFAVLKYGLSNQTLGDTLRVDSNEVKRMPRYLDFRASQFDGNVGTSARGIGLGVRWDKEQYVIPADADTVDFVERAILDELAAESCFEGNRFFDLLCASHHRQDHPALMAELTARKQGDARRGELLQRFTQLLK